MSNLSQNRPAQNMPSYNKPDADKTGNKVRKDEPTPQKKTGGMKDDACATSGSKSSCASTPSKVS